MTTFLFRQEAVDHQRDRLFGEVLLIQPLSLRLLTLSLCTFVMAVLLYLYFGTYARKESVQGHLVPNAGVIRVYAPRPGIIRQVLVEEGASVEAGQPLFVINGDSYLEDGRSLEQLLLDEYQHKQNLLKDQLERLPLTYQRRQVDLQREAEALTEDHQWLARQKATLTEHLELIDHQLTSIRQLHSQHLASESDVQGLLAQRLALLAELQVLERSLASQMHEQSQIASRNEQLRDDERNQKQTLQAELSTLAQQIAELYGRKAYVITAERSGILTALQANEGQDATQGLPLATLLPEGSELAAELLVPTRAIGFIEPGQKINIRYASFPYQKFGLHQGEITGVSNHVLLPDEWRHSPITTNEPMYKVKARINRQDLIAFGQSTPLRPGMTLEADITLDQRTLVQWLLEPLYSLKGRV